MPDPRNPRKPRENTPRPRDYDGGRDNFRVVTAQDGHVPPESDCCND